MDEETNIEDLLSKEEEYDRIQVINQISEEIGLCHPICYDVYDLCEYRKYNKLFKFSNDMLKVILKNFEIPFQARDKKKTFVEHLAVFLQKCLCFEGDA